VRRNPSPFAGHGNGSVSYHNIAFAGPIDSTLAEFGSLERQYELMIEAFAAVGQRSSRLSTSRQVTSSFSANTGRTEPAWYVPCCSSSPGYPATS
jgi:hypothetical protein